MPRARAISVLFSLLLLSGLSAAVQANAQLDSSGPPPTEAELRDHSEKLIANQHADDDALNFYERIEHHVERSGSPNPRVLDDRIDRVVPTGGGTMKIVLRDRGTAVSDGDYQRQLLAWQDVLEMMSTPGNSKGAAARTKYEKRERQRANFVNATKDAFIPKWLGHETVDGHPCDVFELAPNPEFHPSSIFESALARVTAKVWLDLDSNQLVRGEAWVMSDISFVAGIAGKVYRGSRVEIEQAEVAPGIWLPTHYEYDFTGRKFLFPFAQHETIDATHYRRVGPPPEALAEVKSEIASGKGPIEDP